MWTLILDNRESLAPNSLSHSCHFSSAFSRQESKNAEAGEDTSVSSGKLVLHFDNLFPLDRRIIPNSVDKKIMVQEPHSSKGSERRSDRRIASLLVLVTLLWSWAAPASPCLALAALIQSSSSGCCALWSPGGALLTVSKRRPGRVHSRCKSELREPVCPPPFPC